MKNEVSVSELPIGIGTGTAPIPEEPYGTDSRPAVWLESAVRVQHQRRAEQHAGDHQSDHPSGKPSGKDGHVEERSLASRVLRDRRGRREFFCPWRLGYKRSIKVIYFGNKAVALARNRVHQRRLLR